MNNFQLDQVQNWRESADLSFRSWSLYLLGSSLKLDIISDYERTLSIRLELWGIGRISHHLT